MTAEKARLGMKEQKEWEERQSAVAFCYGQFSSIRLTAQRFFFRRNNVSLNITVYNTSLVSLNIFVRSAPVLNANHETAADFTKEMTAE